MTQLGADPEDLRGLARSLRSAAGQLDTLSLGLARRTRAARWRGPDADSFERQWHARHRPALAGASAALADLARHVDRQATEQVSASTGAPAGVVPLRWSRSPAADEVTRRVDEPVLPVLPRVEDRYVGNLELRLGPVAVGIVGELAVQQLGGSRRRVVLTEVGAGGGMVSGGSSADVGIGGPHGIAVPTGGAAGEARLRVGGIERRSWDVDQDAVDDLLARLAVEHGARAVTGSAEPLVVAASAADGLAEWITGRDPGWDVSATLATAVPDPTAHEELVEVELAAGAGAGLGGLTGMAGIGARAQAAGAVRVGTAQRGPARSSVVEVQGSGTAALTSTLLRRLGIALPFDAHRGVLVRLEVPHDQGGTPPSWVDVRVSTTSDDTVQDLMARVDLGGPDAAGTVRALSGTVDALGRGDLTDALVQLDDVRVDAEHVTVASATATLSGTTARAGLTSAAGLGAGIGVRGQVLHLERG